MNHSCNAHDPPPLNGARVLVVEDEFIIMLELASLLEDAGAEIVGPFAGMREALAAAQVEAIEAAVLDLRVGNDNVTPVARKLAQRGIPFVFYTGQTEADPMLAEWPGYRVLGKPAEPAVIVTALVRLLRRARDARAQAQAEDQRPVLR
ncbi:MAG TPA: response regulator [Xanthobacteraceae bacterium]|nr:response regulator [Xanthobacteraceae bacterium]